MNKKNKITPYKKANTGQRKTLIVLSSMLIVTLAVLAGLDLTHAINLFGGDNASKKASSALDSPKTTSAKPTAQPDYTVSNSPKNTSTQPNNNDGGAVDTNGVSRTQNANPVVSDGGKISVLAPAESQKLNSGDVLIGTASVASVQFRLVDDTAGVIAQGLLNVSGSKYSGSLQFHNKGNTGTLKVFSIDPVTGNEINRVEIHVIF